MNTHRSAAERTPSPTATIDPDDRRDAPETGEPTLADLAAVGWHPAPTAVEVQPVTLEEVLARPYAFVATPETIPGDDGEPDRVGWAITFPDLPSCSTWADSWEDIGRQARDVSESWLTSSWERAYPIPQPTGWEPEYLSEDVNGIQWAEARQTARGGCDPRRRVDGLPDPEISRPRWTTAEVATRLDVTRARINQVARDLALGTMVANSRLFSIADLDTIRAARRPAGRPARDDVTPVNR